MGIANKKVAAAIEEAAPLLRQIKEAEARVDELKEVIRAEAIKASIKRGDEDGEEEKIEFESDEGVATVVFVKKAVALIKGANAAGLRNDIPGVWNLLFGEEVVLLDKFEERFAQLPKAQQNVVKKVVVWKERDPRVTLPK